MRKHIYSCYLELGEITLKNDDVDNINIYSSSSIYIDPVWIIGTVLLFIGQSICLLAMTFAPMTLIAGLSAISIVYNRLLALCILKESIHDTATIAKGTLYIIVGTILLLIFSPHTSQDFTADDIKHFLLAPFFICFFLFIIILFTTLLYLHSIYTKSRYVI